MSGPFGSSQWMYKSGDYEIAHSARFNGTDAKLTRTPDSSGNRRILTFSAWIKQGDVNATINGNALFSAGVNGDNFHYQSGLLFRHTGYKDSAYWGRRDWNGVQRDPGGWKHIVVRFDTAQSAETDRSRLFINGVEATQNYVYNVITQNYDMRYNHTADAHWIGALNNGSYFDGYMAEVHWIDGAIVSPNAFGEFGDYGEWKPKEYVVADYAAYGTNGYYLNFADSSHFGKDVSGNGNDYADTGFGAHDQMLDSPTNCFCTLNPLIHDTEFAGVPNAVYTEGNLRIKTNTSGADSSNFFGTFGMTTGKWYWEFVDTGGTVDGAGGVSTQNAVSRMAYYGNGNKYNADGATSYGASFAEDDIIGVAFDADNQSLTFYKNNAGQGTISNAVVANDTYFPFGWDGSGSAHTFFNYNFGQDSTFAGHDTGSNGFSDGNGRGDFYYAPPSGFLALCTNNLPEPDIIPSQYFNAQIWSGDSSGDDSFTTGFQPDLVWFLMRNVDGSREMVDSLRGVTKVLSSDTDVNEFTEAEGLQSFDANGFSLGTNSGGYNRDSRNYLGFSWRAGGGAAAVGSNTDGSINTTDTSAAVEAGFSISTYTGTGATATVGHGLSKVPEIIFVKNRDDDDDWCVFFGDGTDFLRLNTTLALTDDADRWNDTVPTTSVFTVDTDNQVNGDGDTYVAYSFHSVEGHSKIGTYTGNGAADGVFVYLGFRPKFLMCKKTSGTESWWVVDTARKSFNPHVNGIELNATADELAVAKDLDLLANGFKTRKATGYHNDSATYMYMAFAETPFKYANSI